MVAYIAIGGVAFVIYDITSVILMVETLYIFIVNGSEIKYMVWVGGVNRICRNYLQSNLLKGWRKKIRFGSGLISQKGQIEFIKVIFQKILTRRFP